MKINKNAFTLVELIVVITILAILATIAFIAFSGNTSKANKSNIMTNLNNLTRLIEIELSNDADINDLMSGSLLTYNSVNTGATINSGYILWDLNYKIWNLNFYNLKINWENFKIKTQYWDKDYIFAILTYKNWIFFQIAGESNKKAIIYWNYYSTNSTDTKWLISEKWFDIWLKNWNSLTWSLF